MSEKKDQLKEILKDQLNREAKQIEEEVGLTNETLLSAVHDLFDNREKYIDAMKHSSQQDSIDTIIDLIESVTA